MKHTVIPIEVRHLLDRDVSVLRTVKVNTC